MKHCHIILDLLPLYIEDMVSPETAEVVRDHISSCPHCREAWEQMNRPTTQASPSHEEWKTALKKEQRRNLFRNTPLWILTGLLLLSLTAGYLLYDDYSNRFQKHPMVETLMDPKEILSLCPQVIPTADELSIMEEEFLLSSLSSDQQILAPEVYRQFTERAVPHDAVIGEIIGSSSQLTMDYFYRNQRIILVYSDSDLDGTLNELRKYVSHSDKEANALFYGSVYNPSTDTTLYSRFEHIP